jgi:predicted Zn-dependent protease
MHLAEGDVASALDDASASLAGSPNLIQAHFNLASALLRAGRPGDSIAALEHIAQLLPRDVRALEAITQILASQHRYADAIVHAREAYRRQGESREVRSRLARLLILAGQREEGLEHLQAALQQDLDPPKDSLAIAQVFEQAGRADEAVRMYRDMLHRAGAPAAIRRRLAWILATTDNQAVADPATALRMCLELTRGGQQGSPQELDTLAAAYARAGRYNDALVTATRAQSRAREMGDDKFARAIDARLTCYRDSRPFLVTDESAAFVRRFQQGQRAGSSQ